MGKLKGDKWFALHTSNKEQFRKLPPEKFKELFMLALDYMDECEIKNDDELGLKDPLSIYAFATLKQWCDDSIERTKALSAAGQRGADARWKTKNNPDEV